MYGDPQRLYALASEVEEHEKKLRERVASVRARSRETAWYSVAAAKHRERLEHDLRAVEKRADELAEAVVALRAHARLVEDRIALIAAAERQVRTWFSNAQQGLRANLDKALDVVGDVADHVTPWDGWPWSPANLPAPGHVDWIEAADLVRRAAWTR